ncbi:unnamed protein product [Ceratitis capitata]|uniref:(Mediterranean fruit fly) hypothetical protein n=1 Tax=Ceratitis capitata TaxID=7213 RepID=A0A811VHL1_CERCA|nr:unnamed protein product [Ceratitis capitata]
MHVLYIAIKEDNNNDDTENKNKNQIRKNKKIEKRGKEKAKREYWNRQRQRTKHPTKQKINEKRILMYVKSVAERVWTCFGNEDVQFVFLVFILTSKSEENSVISAKHCCFHNFDDHSNRVGGSERIYAVEHGFESF